MKQIDINSWDRKKQYEWFSSFQNSTYSINVKIDVTPLVVNRQNGYGSFFAEFLYAATKAMNECEAMRYRALPDGSVVLFEYANPSFTVAMDNAPFEICRVPWTQNRKQFVAETQRAVAETKEGKRAHPFNDGRYDDFYVSCVTALDFTAATQPIPDDAPQQSIPRILWGKYTNIDGRYVVTVNLTVSHSFVDGEHLSFVLNRIQQLIVEREGQAKDE